MAREIFVWFSSTICLFQFALGIALLVCGWLGVQYTKEQLYTQGPSYSIGAFIAGTPIVAAAIVTCVISLKGGSVDISRRDDVNFFGCLIAMEIVLCVCSLVGSTIGLGMVAMLGLSGDCDPFTDRSDTFISTCNYTEHISTNKLIAACSMGFIMASIVVSFLVMCCNLACKKEFGVYLCRPPRSSSTENQGPISACQAARIPPLTGGNHNYDTVLESGATSNAAAQPRKHLYYTESRIQRLEEENRLLHEQIRLQEQQLELRQQLQQQAGQSLPRTTPMYTPPPPSYEQCVTEESMLGELEEQNKNLQRQWQQQQEVSEKPFPTLKQAGVEPTALPEEC